MGFWGLLISRYISLYLIISRYISHIPPYPHVDIPKYPVHRRDPMGDAAATPMTIAAAMRMVTTAATD